jgi:hypothetical protein
MGRYDVKTTLQRNGEGLIDRIDIEWGETIPALDQLLVAGASLGFIFGGGTTLIGFLAGHVGSLLVGLVLSGLTGLLWIRPRRRRAVCLHASGPVEVPYGTAWYPKPRAISGNFGQIESVEGRADRERHQGRVHEHLYEVVMLFSSGTLIVVSQNLFEETALKVQVQLNHALDALRRDTAEAALRLPTQPPTLTASCAPEFTTDELLEMLVHQDMYGDHEAADATSAPPARALPRRLH